MTVIFKHPRGRTCIPSTHLCGGSKDWRPGKPAEIRVTISVLPAARAELSPQGSRAAKALRPKERDRGTDLGDGQTGCFPCLNEGRFGGVGAVVGV